MTEEDPIAALGELDPRKVDRERFVELLRAASEAASAGTELDLSSLTPEQFARLISRASTEQIDAVMARPELAERILGEVFRRMSEHYKSDKADQGTEAVIRWRIGSPSAEEHRRYECVLSGGTCTVTERTEHEPRATITVGPTDFLKLASGNASPPGLFMKGKLKVAGDLGFAAGLTKLFQIPRA